MQLYTFFTCIMSVCFSFMTPNCELCANVKRSFLNYRMHFRTEAIACLLCARFIWLGVRAQWIWMRMEWSCGKYSKNEYNMCVCTNVLIEKHQESCPERKLDTNWYCRLLLLPIDSSSNTQYMRIIPQCSCACTCIVVEFACMLDEPSIGNKGNLECQLGFKFHSGGCVPYIELKALRFCKIYWFWKMYLILQSLMCSCACSLYNF